MILALLTMSAHVHGHGHGHHDEHKNPADFAEYLARMEDPARAEWQKPDEVVRALSVTRSQTVCDIGTGPGYFALRFAQVAGHVYGVDVEPRMIEALRDRVTRAGVRNVTPVLAPQDHAPLPEGACDLILIVNTYHHFADGVAYLRQLTGALRRGGRLVNIDFHKKDLPVGPPLQHKVTRDEFVKAAQSAGLKVVGEPAFLPYQYFVVMEAK